MKKRTEFNSVRFLMLQLFLFYGIHVNIHLRIRNGDAALVEDLLCELEHIEVYSPVVGGFYPHTEVEYERAVTLFAKTNEGSRILQYEIMCVCEIEKGLLNEVDVGIVGYADLEIKSAGVVRAVIHNHSVGKGTVGESNYSVIGLQNFCVEDADIFDGAAFAASFDVITDGERIENEDHETACEVGKAALKSKADNETARGDDGSNRSFANTDFNSCECNQKNVQSDHQNVDDERLCVGLHVVEALVFANEFENPFDEEGANDKEDDDTQDANTCGSTEFTEFC